MTLGTIHFIVPTKTISQKEVSVEIRKKITFADPELSQILFGEANANLKAVEKGFNISLSTRGNVVFLEGEEWEVDLAGRLLNQLYELVKAKYPLYSTDVDYAIRCISKDPEMDLLKIFKQEIFISSHKKVIVPKSINQKIYIDSIKQYDMVFGIGPAGTGKTYLAMAMAISYLLKKEVNRVILTRPAVEAGERLGFLPGDLYEKVNPYLRPLYDALYDMMDYGSATRLIQQGTIEVAPLAFMRGRTLNDAFIILDEAQNATCEQMKMFLTRMGFRAKAVITGDITQTDLPEGKMSGLLHAYQILREISGIKFVLFSKEDVVRHPLVQEIIDAYEKAELQTPKK